MTSAGEIPQENLRTEMGKTYSETVVEHALHPRNLGNKDDADGFAQITGSCGESMEIWLKVKNDIITEATFMTDGCGTSIAAGSMVTAEGSISFVAPTTA